MLKVQKMFDVWSHLEKNYKDYATSNKTGLTKVDYLKKLLGYEDGVANVTTLRSMLADELPGYSKDEMSLYTDLFELMEQTVTKLDNFSGSISNLDEFVMGTSYDDVESQSPSYLLEHCNLYVAHEFTNTVEALEKGIFCDCSISTENGLESFYFDPEDDVYRYFEKQNDVANFYMLYNKMYYKETLTNQVVFALVDYLLRNKICPDGFGVVMPSISVITKSSISIGKLKIPYSKENVTELKGHTVKTINGTTYTLDLKFIKLDYDSRVGKETLFFICGQE